MQIIGKIAVLCCCCLMGGLTGFLLGWLPIIVLGSGDLSLCTPLAFVGGLFGLIGAAVYNYEAGG